MKKNIVGHMSAPRESVGGRLRRAHILSKLLCLLLAFVIWLTVTDLVESGKRGPEPDTRPKTVEAQ